MARLPRSFTVKAGYEIHKTWRGHNREPNLCNSEDKEFYLQTLQEELEKDDAPASLNAISLMTNHEHEILKVNNQPGYSNLMRRHHSRYCARFNRKYKRSGQVGEGRPKTSLIQNEQYSINAVMYAHANPLRAGIVKDAAAYPWSTHALYAFGHRQSWMKVIRFPKWYIALGKTPAERQAKYRSMFARYLAKEKDIYRAIIASQNYWGDPEWKAIQEDCSRTWLRERTCEKLRTARDGPSLVN